jgi:hypothetical protein
MMRDTPNAKYTNFPSNWMCNCRIRTHTVKFIESVILLQTPTESDSVKRENEFSLDNVPITVKVARPRKLEEDARQVCRCRRTRRYVLKLRIKRKRWVIIISFMCLRLDWCLMNCWNSMAHVMPRVWISWHVWVL